MISRMRITRHLLRHMSWSIVISSQFFIEDSIRQKPNYIPVTLEILHDGRKKRRVST